MVTEGMVLPPAPPPAAPPPGPLETSFCAASLSMSLGTDFLREKKEGTDTTLVLDSARAMVGAVGDALDASEANADGSTRHTRTVPSFEPLATFVPSAENRARVTAPVCPDRIACQDYG